MGEPAFGLNRWDWRSPATFAAQVAMAEDAGFSWAYLPVNALGVPDPYVLMAAGAAATTTLGFGPLLETPRLRGPAVAAGSIATVDAVADGRTMLTYGIGDTAVRWLGDRPATVAELENAVVSARTLLAGDALEVGADRPAVLRHARPVPVWIAAGGPRTLEMAGRVADGVFIRAGRHPRVLAGAVERVRSGAVQAGRDPDEVQIGLIVHTVFADEASGLNPDDVRSISRAMAAGFHEYSPMLFEQAGLEWGGPPVHELQDLVHPDFHHAPDLVAAGEVVSFLDEETAGWFSFHGSRAAIADQVDELIRHVPGLSIVVPHPVPLPVGPRWLDYVRWWMASS